MSIKCVSHGELGKKNFEGLKADVPDLPVRPDNDISTGSTFYAIDTQELWIYHECTNSWYPQQ